MSESVQTAAKPLIEESLEVKSRMKKSFRNEKDKDLTPSRHTNGDYFVPTSKKKACEQKRMKNISYGRKKENGEKGPKESAVVVVVSASRRFLVAVGGKKHYHPSFERD